MGPGRSGGAGMRVTGRTARPGESEVAGRRAQVMKNQRANSSSAMRETDEHVMETTPTNVRGVKTDDIFFSPSGRPRADSAPMPMLLGAQSAAGAGLTGTSMMPLARLGVGGVASGSGILEQAMSASEASVDVFEDNDTGEYSSFGMGGYQAESSIGVADSARPSEMGIIGEASGPLGHTTLDEGSDVDEEEIEEDVEGVEHDKERALDRRKGSSPLDDGRRSSADTMGGPPLDFAPIPVPGRQTTSALTAILNKHIPHLVSTSSAPAITSIVNPFASLYASVFAPSSLPSISLELYFPHSAEPGKALICKVRKDSTVEEVTGYGLFKFWEENREPRLSKEESEDQMLTVGWGLRIVEDDGQVDEDFPRESHLAHHTILDPL